jgi:hypothetical protein
MHSQPGSVRVREISVNRPKAGGRFEGLVFTGTGREVVEQVSRETAQSGAAVLDSIINRLLVKKGADWTAPILSEYLGVYGDSVGTFSLVCDKASRQLVAHGCSLQSKAHGGAALVAHIRCDDAYRGLGLGTLVTEEVTQAAFEQGAQVVVLGTDDKRYRIQQGEKAACSMYSKLGYAILAEKELTDTIEWLMVVDRKLLERCQQVRQSAGGRFPDPMPADIAEMQKVLVEGIREQFGRTLSDGDCPNFRVGENGTVPFGGNVSPVSEGDLANLFLLMNLCPADDFRVKVVPWGVQLGPEMERCYLVKVRPAIVDCDRLEDASLALRDKHGAILAVAAAEREFPFTRNVMQIDFYCQPRFLAANRPAVVALVEAVLARIEQSPQRSSPCRVLFSGIDAEKERLFAELGFAPTANVHPYFTADGQPAFQAREYERVFQ